MPLLPLSADLWIPIAVMAVGFVLCFMGYAAMRIVFAVLGGLFGWQLGMLLGALIHIDPAWDTVALWGGAVLGAILLGTLAYSFYVAGVMLAIGYLGWALGVWLSGTLGVWGWYAVAIAGGLAVVLVVLAFVTRLPKLLLVLATSLIGSGAMVAGLLALQHLVQLDTLRWWNVASLAGHGILWNLLFLALAGLGVLAQLKLTNTKDVKALYS
ncbi:MAG TPA: hypothetical protein PLE12_02410 [Propionicimonas sp.]|jgi:uncharacterized protein YfaA (DUF2138 family)|nr:hypothetical protein [Propionicimonas sp.]